MPQPSGGTGCPHRRRRAEDWRPGGSSGAPCEGAGGFEKRFGFEVVGKPVESGRVMPGPQTHGTGAQDKYLRLLRRRGKLDARAQGIVRHIF